MHQDLPALFIILGIVGVLFVFTIWRANKEIDKNEKEK